MIVGFSMMTIFFGYQFFKRNAMSYENGRYFESEQLIAYQEHSVLVFQILFIASLILTAVISIYFIKRFKKLPDDVEN